MTDKFIVLYYMRCQDCLIKLFSCFERDKNLHQRILLTSFFLVIQGVILKKNKWTKEIVLFFYKYVK